MPPGRADRGNRVLDAVLVRLNDNDLSITSDIDQWCGTGGERACNRLAQQGSPGTELGSCDITHLNLSRSKVGGGRCTHYLRLLEWVSVREQCCGGWQWGCHPTVCQNGCSSWGGGCPVPTSESWWVPLLELLWLHLDGARTGSGRHGGGGGLSEAAVPTVCQQHLRGPPGKDPYFLHQQKRGGSWQSSSPGISLALSMG